MREPRRIDQPEPGFFKIRLVKGGPWLAARIDRNGELWSAWINGRQTAAPSTNHVLAGVEKLWLYGHQITEADYWDMLGRETPDATTPADLQRIPSPF